jgi:hypothetical protein
VLGRSTGTGARGVITRCRGSHASDALAARLKALALHNISSPSRAGHPPGGGRRIAR